MKSKSKFQFSNPVLSRIEFSFNKEFALKKEDEITMKMEFSVQTEEKSSNEARVSLVCELGDKSSQSPFWLLAEEEAFFKWEFLDVVLADKLLKQNAPSLLLSYLRPIVTQVTQASPCGAYNIPFMNFAE